MLENAPAPLHGNLLPPHEQIPPWKVSPTHNPLYPTPPPNQQIPLKTFVHFLITIIICKHWSKFVTCSYLRILIRRLREKMSVEGGLGALQFFWSLKKGTRTLHFRSNEALLQNSRTTGSIRSHPWEKEKKQTNK